MVFGNNKIEVNQDGSFFFKKLIKNNKSLYYVISLFTVCFSLSAVANFQRPNATVAILYIYLLGYILYLYLIVRPQLNYITINKNIILDIEFIDGTICFNCLISMSNKQMHYCTTKNLITIKPGFTDAKEKLYDKEVSRIIIDQTDQTQTLYFFQEYWADYQKILSAITEH